MKIAVLGTGTVGQTLAGRLSELGHDVILGTRDVDKTMSRTLKDSYGGESFTDWHSKNKHIKLVTFENAAVFGEVIINASNGVNSIAALKLAGASNLSGKTLIDLANALDSSKGMPPVLTAGLCNTNSLAEEIQRTFPKTSVVKALNTMWCGIMINPDLINKGDHNVFICGNDLNAKITVTVLLKQFGWKSDSIIDLGDITAARAVEMMLPVWLRIMNSIGTGTFNFKIATK